MINTLIYTCHSIMNTLHYSDYVFFSTKHDEILENVLIQWLGDIIKKQFNVKRKAQKWKIHWSKFVFLVQIAFLPFTFLLLPAIFYLLISTFYLLISTIYLLNKKKRTPGYIPVQKKISTEISCVIIQHP